MFMYQRQQKKQGMWTTMLILNVLGLGVGAMVSFSYLVLPQLTKLASVQDHSTALPWISSEKDCEAGVSRFWMDGACWDMEHDASF